ncbi:MAG: DUF3352 domain-containing protein [Chloroflexota bacterium]|nr:DUF3352 domain-containing protein [Chloroflexota bacterium]
MTESVRSSSGMSAGRMAIIGGVGVLAVGIGVAAGSFLLTTRSADVGSGAAYVPADAPFYVEMRLEPSEAQDGALREMLGHFPPIEGVDLDQPLYAQLVARVDEMLAEEEAGVSWSQDVAPWFDGHVAVAVTEIPVSAMAMPVDPMTVPEVPPAVVLLGVSDRAAAETGIGRLLAEAGDGALTFSETEHAGVIIRSVDGSETGAYALTDDQLVIGSDADAVAVALDTHANGSGTLAEMAEMTKLTDALPEDWLVFATYDLTDLMADALAEGAAASPEIAAAFESLLQHQPLRGAMAVSASGDRILLDAATDPPTGPFTVENEDRGLAAEVPGDTLYFSEAGNLGAAFAAVIEPVKEALATTPEGEEGIGTAESALGADIEDLVSWIDDGAVAIGYDGTGPYGGLVLVPNDMAAAERRLGQLASFAGLGALDPSSGITVSEDVVDDVTITSIRWEDPNAAPESMFPTPTSLVVEYAVTDDRVLIGFGDTFVRRVLSLEDADALAAQPRYVDAITEMGGSENAGVTWFDLAGTREAIEAALGPMIAEGDVDGIYESEVRPWLLPLDRIVGVVRLEGDVLIQRGALVVD